MSGSQSSLNIGGSLHVGYNGSGTFTQSGGSNTISNYLYIGENTGSSGRSILSGNGSLSVGYVEEIGVSGPGSFQQTGGTNSAQGLSVMIGSYSLSGNGKLTMYGEYVGGSLGAATFSQSGGTNTIIGTGSSNCLFIGDESTDTGECTLSNTGVLSVGVAEYELTEK